MIAERAAVDRRPPAQAKAALPTAIRLADGSPLESALEISLAKRGFRNLDRIGLRQTNRFWRACRDMRPVQL
jgi:hypothetical protein